MFNIKNLLIDFDAQNRILVKRLFFSQFISQPVYFHNTFYHKTCYGNTGLVWRRTFFAKPVPLIL
jgi:hypothetical protein